MEELSRERPYILLMYVQRAVYGRKFEFLGNLGISSLAAYLENKGYKARAFTGITTDAADIFAGEFQKSPITAAGFYCDYDNQTAVEEMSRHLKMKYGVKVIIGGPHAINLGEEFIRRSGCDFIVRGDGEAALFELMEYIADGRGGLEKISGILYIDENGSFITNPPRDLSESVDEYPFPSNSFELGGRKRYNLSVMAARGCPFRCAFCFEGGNTKKLRPRSVKKVIEEIRTRLIENPEANYLWFVDDTFTLNYDRTAEFCERLSELRKERDFVWFCEGHASLLAKNPGLIKLMVNSGMVRMQIGMESGCPESLKSYHKQATIQDIEEVARICAEAGLPQLAGNFIIGGSHETQDTLERTASFVERLHEIAPGLIDISTTFIMPLPNTAISKSPRDFGVKILDHGSYTTTEDFPVNETDSLSRFEISGAAKKFLVRCVDRMEKIFKDGLVPREKIKRHFELSLKYSLSSSWYRFIYSKDQLLKQYYEIMILRNGSHFDEISFDKINYYYPRRTFNDTMYDGYFNSGNYFNRVSLTAIEFDISLLCDGRNRVDSILSAVCRKYRCETPETVLRLLISMENKRLIVFIP
ncbi:MAG: radical SAM protein [Candidatus Wallbacteria bacterium]